MSVVTFTAIPETVKFRWDGNGVCSLHSAFPDTCISSLGLATSRTETTVLLNLLFI